MSTYKEINGTGIEVLSADPPNPQDGQVWYRSDLGTFKTQKISTIGGWATGGNLPTPRVRLAGAGTATAAIASGGPGQTSNTYNGTSWSSIPNMGNERMRHMIAGTQTAALTTGGFPESTDTELWNGTNWTEVNNTNTARDGLAGSGISTSALIFAGGPSTTTRKQTESWNGTNWTEVADLSISRNHTAGAGTSNTSAICFGGTDPLRGSPPTEETTTATEEWNGTNWTTGGSMNSKRYYLAGAGTATSAITHGGEGSVGAPALAEVYNGTAWTTVAPLNIGRFSPGAAGASGSSALAFGGDAGANDTDATEEFSNPASVTQSITLE